MREAWWMRLVRWYVRCRLLALQARSQRNLAEVAAIDRVLQAVCGIEPPEAPPTVPDVPVIPCVARYRPSTFETSCAEYVSRTSEVVFLIGDRRAASVDDSHGHRH